LSSESLAQSETRAKLPKAEKCGFFPLWEIIATYPTILCHNGLRIRFALKEDHFLSAEDSRFLVSSLN
jgi:hypothetical protein